MRYLGVIPSFREPKSISLLGDKPLIAHTIKAANESGIDFCISSEDAVIRQVAYEWSGHILPIEIPEELVKKADTTTGEVALHALETLESRGWKYDAVVILSPTSPFRTARHIKEAIARFEDTDLSCTVSSACAIPWKDHKNVTNGYRTWWLGGYVLNGAIDIVPVDMLKKTKSHHNEACVLYVMDRRFSVNIQDEFDWIVAQALCKDRGIE